MIEAVEPMILIAERDRPAGGDVTDAVMVDDLQQVRLFHAFYRLRIFIVIDQDHLLVAIIEDVITREIAAQMIVVVDDRIAAVTALQHLLADILHKFVHIEADQRF